MADHVAQDAPNGTEACKLLKKQRDDSLGLFIRVFDHLPRGPAHVAHRNSQPQFAPPGFGLLACQEPLFQDVEFCLGYGSFEP
jgi:hypothetical protein